MAASEKTLREFIYSEIKKVLISENDFDPEEGPQPGDAEYHMPDHHKLSGLSKIKDIDWQVLHEALVANTIKDQTGKIEGNPNYIEMNVGDMMDDFMSKEDVDLLEEHNIIQIIDKWLPILGDDRYMDYTMFITAVQQAWEKGFDTRSTHQDHGEAPYLRGREDVQETINLNESISSKSFEKVTPNVDIIKDVKKINEEFARMKQLVDFRSPLLSKD